MSSFLITLFRVEHAAAATVDRALRGRQPTERIILVPSVFFDSSLSGLSECSNG
jgi:hypothetical protein